MSYTMESGKSILQVLGKCRLILLCGGEQLFMISPEKMNPPNMLIHKRTHQFLAIRRYKMEMQISF